MYVNKIDHNKITIWKLWTCFSDIYEDFIGVGKHYQIFRRFTLQAYYNSLMKYVRVNVINNYSVQPSCKHHLLSMHWTQVSLDLLLEIATRQNIQKHLSFLSWSLSSRLILCFCFLFLVFHIGMFSFLPRRFFLSRSKTPVITFLAFPSQFLPSQEYP